MGGIIWPAGVSNDDAGADGDSPPAPLPEEPPEGCDSATLAVADGLGLRVFVGGGAGDCAREGDGLGLLDLAGVNEDVGDGVTSGDLDTVGVGDRKPVGRRVAEGLGLLGLAGVNEDIGDGVGVGEGKLAGRRVAEGNGDGVFAGDKVADTVGCVVGEGRALGVAVALGETDCVGELADGRGDGETVGEVELAGFAVAACKVAEGWGFPPAPPGAGFGFGVAVGVSG